MIFDKVKQLDRNIKDFRAGILSYDGIDPTFIDAISPVIATVVPVPQFVGFPRYVDAKIAELEYLADAKPLQFMPAEALEMLVPAFLAGHSLVDILESKLADDFWKSQSLRNFLVIARPELLEFPPPANHRFERVKDIVRSWGLAV
jgi:hypothetical protein